MDDTLYIDNDLFVCAWLRDLVRRGLLAGTVLEADVRGNLDLGGYRRVHFFAGIGGWELAAKLAGWPDDVELWTGSCPCQPFSGAGQRKGVEDERHLWPDFFRHVREHRPRVVAGEQVAGPDARAWLDLVFADLEGAGYAVAAADLPAAGVGAPHKRQRIFWCAIRNGEAMANGRGLGREQQRAARVHAAREPGDDASRRGADGAALGNPLGGGVRQRPGVDAEGQGCDDVRGAEGDHQPGGAGAFDALGDAQAIGREPRGLRTPRRDTGELGRPGVVSPWIDGTWIECRDGFRLTQPGVHPLVDGVPNRLERGHRGKLIRGYGNAIVPQVAALFLRALMEVL